MNTWINKITGDSLVYGVAPFVSNIVGFFLLPLYTKYLIPTDYGFLLIVSTSSLMVITIASHGMTSALFRFYKKDIENRQAIASICLYSIYIASSLVLCLLIVNVDWVLDVFGYSQTYVTNTYIAFLLFFLAASL